MQVADSSGLPADSVARATVGSGGVRYREECWGGTMPLEKAMGCTLRRFEGRTGGGADDTWAD